MNEEAPFLNAIKADPEDLFLRLVYADWLEEHGDPRSEYLRVDGKLQELTGPSAPNELTAASKVRQLRVRLRKLGKALDPTWVALLDALRPRSFRCSACGKVLSAKEAIDTNPRGYRKMKTSRYCKLCYEDAVRSQLHRGMNPTSRRNSAARDYHGVVSDDD
jgi:uncharacterized protein (TIGR02996 family)